MLYIVTPCLNAADTIDRTIVSVVTQAGDFEIRYHVQDGGSTDGTLEALERWKGRLRDRSIPIQCAGVSLTFDSAKDTGMYDALTNGFESLFIPETAFMTWINADDILMPGALALVNKVEDTFSPDQVSWLAGASAILKDDAQIVQVDRPTPTRVIREGLCDGKHWDFVQQEGVFFRNWLWTGVDPRTTIKRYKYAGDWNLWRVFAQHAAFTQVPWPLGAFRLRAGQLSQQSFDAYMAEIELVIEDKKRAEALQALGDSSGIVRRILRTHYPSGRLYVVERLADGQVHHHYYKNFSRWPTKPLDLKARHTERIVIEAATE